jgi:F0F1-type ATP synthase assembly protein I
MGDEQKNSGERDSVTKNVVSVQKYAALGIILPCGVLVGWFLGSLLDRWLGTHWIYIVGLLIGIAAGFVQFIRTALSAEKNQ